MNERNQLVWCLFRKICRIFHTNAYKVIRVALCVCDAYTSSCPYRMSYTKSCVFNERVFRCQIPKSVLFFYSLCNSPFQAIANLSRNSQLVAVDILRVKFSSHVHFSMYIHPLQFAFWSWFDITIHCEHTHTSLTDREFLINFMIQESGQRFLYKQHYTFASSNLVSFSDSSQMLAHIFVLVKRFYRFSNWNIPHLDLL